METLGVVQGQVGLRRLASSSQPSTWQVSRGANWLLAGQTQQIGRGYSDLYRDLKKIFLIFLKKFKFLLPAFLNWESFTF